MHGDPALAALWRSRTAGVPGMGVVLDAWAGHGTGRRAPEAAARGDLATAAACGGPGWRALARGDLTGALEAARKGESTDSGLRLLEAEALLAAGAIVAGLERLEALHGAGMAPATLALARRRHMLGDHRGAAAAAQTLPMHVEAALIGARAELAADRTDAAAAHLAPFLEGRAPVGDPTSAGALAVLAASVLARSARHARLAAFAEEVMSAPDLPPQMTPAAARTAWIGGHAKRAWERFGAARDPWDTAARLELALLAGDAGRARALIDAAGPLGAPGAPTLRILEGGAPARQGTGDTSVLRKGMRVHLWRTHPHRWQPWIDAARASDAEIRVCDLAAGVVPDAEDVPQAVLDDASLVDLVAPRAVKARNAGAGVWTGRGLCAGVGIGHDWPENEDRTLRETTARASRRAGAAVEVLGADEALAAAARGRPTVVIAPPGDPFWAGPLPQRAWPAMRIVRADAARGWEGVGETIGRIANALQGH